MRALTQLAGTELSNSSVHEKSGRDREQRPERCRRDHSQDEADAVAFASQDAPGQVERHTHDQQAEDVEHGHVESRRPW